MFWHTLPMPRLRLLIKDVINIHFRAAGSGGGAHTKKKTFVVVVSWREKKIYYKYRKGCEV